MKEYEGERKVNMSENKLENDPGNPFLEDTSIEEPEEKKNTLGSDEAVGRLETKLEELKKQVGVLEVEFKTKIKYDQHKEKTIDQLHKEVQEYKNDLIKTLTRPVFMDIIHTIDNINKLAENYKAKEPAELDPMQLINQMSEIASELVEILFRHGVDPFNCQQAEFDPKRQKIIKTDVIGDQLKDKTISKRVQDGYEWDHKILRRESVNVYVYKPITEDRLENKNEEKE
jgi:molecular chaperone GrpE